MRIFPLIVTAIALGAPAIAAAQEWTPAQEKRLSRAYDDCVKAAAGAFPATMECIASEYEIQDGRLNQAYRMVMTRLPTARRASLRTAQRGWISQRNTKCQRAWDEAGGGQASDMERTSCLLRETIARTMWLERYR